MDGKRESTFGEVLAVLLVIFVSIGLTTTTVQYVGADEVIFVA